MSQLLGQLGSTQRHVRSVSEDEELLVEQVVALAAQSSRCGYRRIAALLRDQGWRANHKRVETIWRQEVLKVPQKQPKRGRPAGGLNLKDALWQKETGSFAARGDLMRKPLWKP